MPEIKVTPLGAGQDVGRSCILVSIAGKNVMLDCGMHMGFNDDRRFPDFSYITQNGRLTDFLDCVIISHFHLDHCGALPYFSEMVGYDGPIYMTHPTKAICPILLEDFRKITVDKKGETNFFTSQMIKDCMKKVVAVHLHQTVQVDSELEIKAYYAGHVLGAAMFQIKVGCESVVYTGDYNMTPDRHLGAAWIDKCRPNLMISESTYATTIRDSKRCRERDFLKKVHESIERGGKVLIPVFALGRAQELCILLETFCWNGFDAEEEVAQREEEGTQLGVQCHMPANGETVSIFTNPNIPVDISLGLLKRELAVGPSPASKKPKLLHGTLIIKDNSFRLVSSEQALKELGLGEHQLRFTCRIHFQDPRKEHETGLHVYNHLKSALKDYSVQHLSDASIMVESILIQVTVQSEDPTTKLLLVSWTYQDEEMGSYVTSLLKKALPQITG
ncbi:integrator complex subunit 11 [Protobothrops mucrosquamatus]|uniref:integrator complex subunit 11 n=1 Tax=Protobothrops mucrosquamatus TaxID=103944 RepID=UPI000775DC2E|nr:integrator complex subunit 11 [Protobothrops mucrosquamatus]